MTGKRSGKLAFCGVMTALALVFLLLTATPVSTVALAALAAVCGIPVVVEAGKRAALLHFVAVAVLASLLVPTVEGKGMYIALFGWYTVFKAWLESKRLPRVAEWGSKLAVFVVALAAFAAVMWLTVRATFPYAYWTLTPIAVLLCGVFLVYDWGLSGLVGLYMSRLHRPISRLFRF
ncbi:MAG: hypothetical protein IJ518_07260 [Clostridia bacterium]|nr:hypothetical protein [Clostridia bacterium]